jgi:hypothetical protein
MSLKNVLDTARKLGIPVVITDEEGEAAQVVMPFEDFAALVGATSPSPRPSATSSRKPRVTSQAANPTEDEVAQALADLTIERLSDQANQAAERLEQEMGVRKSDEGFLEDKFYLEPLEDEDSLKQ